MKKLFAIFLAIVILTSCSGSDVQNRNFENSLAHTKWSSDFYYYHNNYIFLDDHTGIGEDCILARGLGDMLPDSTIHPDSILEGEKRPFYYLYKDTVLVVFFPETEYSDSNKRIFHRRITNGGTTFESEYEYVYGSEVLVRQN